MEGICFFPIYEKGDTADCSDYRGKSLLPTAYNISVSRLTPRVDERIGIINMDFDVIDQLLIRYSASV